AAEIAQEKQRLLEAIEMGKRWQGVLRQGSLPMKVEILFTGQAEQRTACISSSDDPWQRTLYRGAVQQQPAGFDGDSASPPAAWRLVLRADRSSFPLAKGWPEHIAFEAPPKNAQADRDLTRGNPPIDQRLLARVGAESIELSPPANAGGETQPAALLERLRQAVQPGVQWQGTSQAPDQASQEIKLTFCALRDKGGYARVVIEPADDPWSVRVFEGLVRLNATEAAAWPIQLAPDLRLSVQADGTLIGWQGRERLHLKTSQPTQNWQAPASLVRETVAPGRRYEGTVQSRGRAAEEIAVTFAERRGDGEYVRAIVEHKSDVLAAAVYEGAARFEESAVSGFSIVLTMKASGFGELPLFKAWADNLTLSFRPLPDGRSLYGYDSGGDRLKLSLATDAELPPLDTVSFSAMLREKCGPGKAWIGKLTNSQVNESADVHLTFGPQNADASSISAVVSVAKARGPKVNYEGVMHLDDARVNQFALELTKKTKGPVARSTVFNGWTDTKLLLRMSLDGSRLYGQAHHELLELRERNVHRVAPRRTMDEADSKQE
ncbi:MAG TPA: hypothetical protein VHC19_19305, partial [Pirellulales bacterium]|nr:hypothetical protein [Pirellulales bacterium]